MKTKENKKIYIFFVFVLIFIAIIFTIIQVKNNSYAKETSIENKNIKISNAKKIDINDIIQNNTIEKEKQDKEEIETTEEVLEFLTKYKTNKDLPKGTMQVIQEGREGIQEI